MKRQNTIKNTVKFTSVLYIVVVIGILALVNACTHRAQVSTMASAAKNQVSTAALQQNQPQTFLVTVANIRKSGSGAVTEVMFNELAELFSVQDATMISNLQGALNANTTVKVTIDPWQATVLQVSSVTREEAAAHAAARAVNNIPGSAYKIDLANTDPDQINNLPASAVINTTTPGLTDVIPDMATAQLMFDYITHQCCALPGPYTIDYCIPFQYCEDGCYARAHKMCWIINNKYNYATHKIFSFANSGHDELCVKGEKWGGCCVNWWYHVAPLVNINSPKGTSAYVIDPAMFDQPVLLATWLHAQENPACVPSGDVPHVSMINIQPTASYCPNGTTGYLFYTDPAYASTDTTLVHYAPLVTCP